MEMIIKRPAVKVRQGKLVYYATSFKVKHLLEQNFYRVDKLDASDSSSGFQRVLDESRAKKLATFIEEGIDEGDVFLPTSVFLATDKVLPYDEEKNEITIAVNEIGSFNVVDGQHRIEGLKRAAANNSKILDFEISANIAVQLDDVAQMCHFLIVNTTQKSVDKSVEQHIVARLTSMVDIKDIPSLPRWIKRQVMRGEDKVALSIANYLNTEKDSPWFSKIRMANEPKDQTSIDQKSFVNNIKMYILSSSNPLNNIPDLEKRNLILKNYWKAIADLLTIQGQETVIFKTIGLEVFSIVSITVFHKLLRNGNFKVETIKDELQNAFERLPSEFHQMKHAEFWASGSGASDMNKSAARKFANELNRALNSDQVDKFVV